YVAGFTYQINNPRQRISHDLLKLKAHYHFRSGGRLNLQYGGQFNSRREFDLRRGGRSDIAALDLQLITHTLDVVFEHPPRKSWRGSLGIQGLQQDNTNVPGTGIRPLIPQYRNTGLGVFWLERLVKEKAEFEVGVRYDHRFLDVLRFDRNNNLLNPQFNFNNVSGTLGAVYTPHPFLSLRSNLASAWRPPNVAELYSEGLHHGTGTIEEGNENLQTEKAYKWINTLTYSTIPAEGGKGIALEASAYYNYIRNYIFLEPVETRFTIRGAFPVFRYNQTRTTFTGLDASVRWSFTKNLSLQSKASLVRAKDVSRSGFLIFIPADRFENTLTYQPTRVGTGKDLYVSLGIVNVSRQFRAPPVFTIAQVRQAATDDSVVVPNQTFDFVAAPAGYLLLNLHAGFTLPVASQKLSVHVGVNNLLNVAYRDYMNRFRYFSDDAGRNWTLRLKYTFDFLKKKG
ncbi:MAG: TonB-dependent receptor, partial [Ferruginibacter sp.]|nr:TonB-dependent receptor [Cytophagales bacterium]